ncbi:LysM peptidoglycan-binding domain-containing protein [Gaiella sp.]|uniref:LysM peptidoglycan-binding domain-containing protein n=1 Tax=Gaiella sp. TaxID=2663207 RepID=UPI002E3383CA|nr:LysM peptidoglycan-binding domain-containing protein [Gaiella sp.]HEX5583369.1 LysM peptidoglycan-binding domain-containing protein [Gaiella sp.]
MRRTVVIVVAAAVALALAGPAVAAPSARIAALQVALRSHGLYKGAVDGIQGPKTRGALLRFQRKHLIRATGKVGMATRCKLGRLGTPLLGQRMLARGRVGWDVTSLEFRLRSFGLPAKRVDGRFDAATAAALRRFQRSQGLPPDGIAGVRTFRALAHPKRAHPKRATPRRSMRIHVVRPGEGFTQIARQYRVSAAKLARANGLTLASVIVPGQKLRVPGKVAPSKRPAAAGRSTPVVVHTVQAGEGFSAIARRYGVSAATLATANGLTLASVIVPGQKLRVPGAKAAVATTKPASTPKPRTPRLAHTVSAGESFFSIAQRYHVSPWRLAQQNRLRLMSTIVPGQQLALPPSAHLGVAGPAVGQTTVTAAIDRWAGYYGVDPKLARALAWMESGFQEDVVSSAGAIGVMQLLPQTWEWVDTVLLGESTPRTYDGNVRAGVRYLRWQLDQFDGDVRLALAGYYQGARAVRQRGLFDDTKQYVAVIRGLYGSV